MKCKYMQSVVLLCFIVLAVLIPDRANAVRFSHNIHSQNSITECVQCHKPLSMSIIPERKVCFDCHKEGDIVETVLGPTKTHTPLWVTQHGRESIGPASQCKSCHTLSFCADCHKGGDLNPDFSRKAVRTEIVPDTHTARFRVVHPLKATGAQIDECFTCHAEEFCSDCHDRTQRDRLKILSHRESWTKIEAGAGGPLHQTFTPGQCGDCHPGGALSSSDWSTGHANEARKTLKSCQSCHPDGNVCLDCHSAKTGLMVSPHPRNWGKVKSKFRKESPEICAKCHTVF